MQNSPTGPQPQTATVSPGSMLQFSAAMYPVGKMSDRNSTCSSVRCAGTLTGPTSANGHADVLGLPAGVPAHHVRVPEQPAARSSRRPSPRVSAFGFELSQAE